MSNNQCSCKNLTIWVVDGLFDSKHYQWLDKSWGQLQEVTADDSPFWLRCSVCGEFVSPVEVDAAAKRRESRGNTTHPADKLLIRFGGCN